MTLIPADESATHANDDNILRPGEEQMLHPRLPAELSDASLFRRMSVFRAVFICFVAQGRIVWKAVFMFICNVDDF